MPNVQNVPPEIIRKSSGRSPGTAHDLGGKSSQGLAEIVPEALRNEAENTPDFRPFFNFRYLMLSEVDPPRDPLGEALERPPRRTRTTALSVKARTRPFKLIDTVC